MAIRKLIVFLILSFSVQLIQAQTETNHQRLKAAKEAMADQDYLKANQHFRAMLSSGEALPAEMCYYFAVTLFQLEQFGNSKAFNDKYQQLTKKQGPLQQESQTLADALQTRLQPAGNCSLCDEAGYLLEECQLCTGKGSFAKACNTCLGARSLVCTVCKGDGVAITTDKLGSKVYTTCATCEGDGQANCRVCKGEGFQQADCTACKGSGLVATKKVCSHAALVH